jgi:hypothetical protein
VRVLCRVAFRDAARVGTRDSALCPARQGRRLNPDQNRPQRGVDLQTFLAPLRSLATLLGEGCPWKWESSPKGGRGHRHGDDAGHVADGICGGAYAASGAGGGLHL